MGSLFQVLGIQRHPKTHADSWSNKDVVCDSRNTTVIYLCLYNVSKLNIICIRKDYKTFAHEVGSRRCLLASSRPTLLEPFESQVALAPASTVELTLW